LRLIMPHRVFYTTRGRGQGPSRRDRRYSKGNYSRSRSATRQDDEPDVRDQMMIKMSGLMEDIMGRLDRLESRNPQSGAQPPPPSHQPELGKGLGVRGSKPQTSNPAWSENPDFKGLVANSFKYTQTVHHRENWQTIPASISKSVDKVVENIRPPRPTEALKARLNSAATSFKEDISDIVKTHLTETIEHTKEAIGALDHTDIKLAHKVVAAQYKRKMGKRARDHTLESALASLESWSKPKKTNKQTLIKNTQTHTVAIHNKFDALADMEPDDDEELVTAAEISSPGGVRRKANSPPSTSTAPKSKRQVINTRIQENPDEIITIPPSPPTGNKSGKMSATVPPSTPSETRSGGEVVICDPTERHLWNIDPCGPNVNTLAVTDSNGATWVDIPPPTTWVTYAFRGGRLDDAAKILSAATNALKNIRTVVLALGVNDRTTDPNDTLSALHQIRQWGERHGKRVIFSAIPPFPIVNMANRKQLDIINAQAADIFQRDYVDAIPFEDLEIRQDDRLAVHYTSDTAERIVADICTYLNNL